MTMKSKSSITLIIFLIAGLINLSEEYGTKGGQQSFSHSYSSSSASAHASSYSSSSSYGSGDLGKLPIIGPIPVASSLATATASAGASSAVASAHATAGSGSYNHKNIQGNPDGNGGYVKDSSYSASGNHAGASGSTSGITGAIYSPSNGKNTVGAVNFPASVDGSYGNAESVHGSQTSTGFVDTVSSSGYTGSSGTGTKGNTELSDKSFDKKYIQPTDEENLRVPAYKNKFPGPDGSIYDYKVPSQGSSGYRQTTAIESGNFVGNKPFVEPYGLENTGGSTYSKPCCKGPFPGPSGSIYDSKPASAVGTAIKSSPSYQITMPEAVGTAIKPSPSYQITMPVVLPSKPNTRIPNSSGSKPVAGNGYYGYQSNEQSSASATAGTYQTQYGTSSGFTPTCTQGSCTKTPDTLHIALPVTHIIPPVIKNKPVTEIIRESEPQDQTNIGLGDIAVEPQSTIPISQNTVGSVYAAPKPTSYYPPSSLQTSTTESVPKYSEPKVQETPKIPVEIPIISNPKGSSSSYGSSTITGGSLSVSNAGTYSKNSVYSANTATEPDSFISNPSYGTHSKPSGSPVKMIDENQGPNDADRIVYVSNPVGETGYFGVASSIGKSDKKISVTENISKGGGLQEGIRGFPFPPQPFPKINPQIYHQNKDVDSDSHVTIPTKTTFIQPADTTYKTKITTFDQPGIIFTEEDSPQSSSGKTFSSISTSSVGAASSSSKVSYSSSALKSDNGDSKVIYNDQKYYANHAGVKDPKPIDRIINHEHGEPHFVTETMPVSSIGTKQPITYTNTIYVDLGKQSSMNDDGTIKFLKSDKNENIGNTNGILPGSGVSDKSFVSSHSGSGSYSGASRGFSSGTVGVYSDHKGIPCHHHRCGTSYRHYSNAVPSTETKNFDIYISSVPIPNHGAHRSTYGLKNDGDLYSNFKNLPNTGTYSQKGQTRGSSYIGSHVGSYGTSGISSYGVSGSGSYGKSGSDPYGTSGSGSYGTSGGNSYGGHSFKGSESPVDVPAGLGGFLSSIFLDGNSGAAENSGSYSKSGGYASSGSFVKGNSYSGSSSYASASSGAYGSSYH